MDKDKSILDLLVKVSFLERELSWYQERMGREVAHLKDDMGNEISRLREENAKLRERLARYENPKIGRNGSIPPSKDENRPKKNRSLRKKTGRKPGGRPGRKGNTLEMVAHPDHVVDLRPEYCRDCGSSLAQLPSFRGKTRQIVDLPQIRAVWTEYRAHGKQCVCGCRTVADFLQGVDFPVSYGPNIEGLVGYLHARQYLPFSRMQELFNDVMGVGISEGGIHCLLGRFAEKAEPAYRETRRRVAASKVVGTDETGAKVGGERHWFWTWQTPNLTYIAHDPTRGTAAVEANFPDGFPNATLVHDGWRPQKGTPAENHQTCPAHLLRHLEYLGELYRGNPWPRDFARLLRDAIEISKEFDPPEPAIKRAWIVQRLEGLLDRPPDKGLKELFTFYRRMCRERQQLFTFLFLPGVPPDNNASERAIRNIKVKQKISGQFKKDRSAQNFAMIRSVIDTTIKNGMNVLEALSLIAKLQPQRAD